jgi:glycosyltransferase involved in cell wall biosynthesis
MIVKNEADRIERCLASALPFVKSVVIYDTGSVDDTLDRIADACQKADVPYILETGEFRNFSYARNAAWMMAKRHNGNHTLPWCQYALLMDADMELVVDPGYNWHELANANGTVFTVMQHNGAISYANQRIANLQLPKDNLYVGVTHEYIDVGPSGMITGIRFTDHADGANRKDKYVRDAELLEDDLKRDPNNSRSWFYLANTYANWGDTDESKLILAKEAYRHRIEMGGWDEETHEAMMKLADVCRKMGDDAAYVAGMVGAFGFRPTRAEPLYWLAEYYRVKGEPHAALLFVKQGMKLKRPNDLLFVNNFAHSFGCRYEYTISGYYDPAERDSAFQVANDLALDPACPDYFRWAARQNLYWYTKTLSELCPSTTTHAVAIPIPEGMKAVINPSVEVDVGGHINCNFRVVNYEINAEGQYMIGDKNCHEAPIETRNFLAKLDGDFNVMKLREILWDRPAPKFDKVIGLEDIRLYRSRGELWFNACVREQASNGTCQQWRGKLVHDIDDKFMFVEKDGPISGEDSIEKNWMPIQMSGEHAFIYRLDKIMYPDRTEKLIKIPTSLAVGEIAGSSQALPFRAGYICVVHEAAIGPDGKRTYWHRFAWLNHELELRRLSLPFVFEAKQIEFCAGLAFHPNGSDFILSYGVRDAEAHFAKVNMEEVAQMLWKFHEN